MNVSDLMTKAVVTVGVDHSVQHAAQIMLANRVSGLPVVNDLGRVVGMLTEGDLLRRIGREVPGWSLAYHLRMTPDGAARDFVRTHSWKVGDAMSAPAVTITEDAPVSKAAELLETRGIKRLPVVRDGRLVGVISRADLLHCIVDAASEATSAGDPGIRTAIAARLREAASAIAVPPTVTVRDGVVQAWGTLQSQAERDVIRVIVDSVAGVAGYVDNTFISPPAPVVASPAAAAPPEAAIHHT